MSFQKLVAGLLRGIGILLVVLGVIHLAATPFIRALLDGSSREGYRRAVGPTLLNHVLVGILLFPLGYTTWLGSAAVSRGEPWARRVLAVNALVVLTLPALLLVFMRQAEYYTAPLFVTAVVLVSIIALLTVTATYLLLRE